MIVEYEEENELASFVVVSVKISFRELHFRGIRTADAVIVKCKDYEDAKRIYKTIDLNNTDILKLKTLGREVRLV